MSDALCGPANPLQQFRKQTQTDRTLQQDRLSNRQHPAQGFRSADPNAGLLDPEFEAFQAGLPPQEFANFHPQQAYPPPAFPQQFQQPSAGPSWADDFQRMNLSPPPAQQQYHAPGPSTANWAQGFREHIAQNAPRAQSSSPSPFAFQQRARYGINGFQSNFAQPSYTPAMQSKGKEPATEQFDEAAFERAFDMAREDMMIDKPLGTHARSAEQVIQDIETSQEAHGVTKDDVRNMNDDLEQRKAQGEKAVRSVFKEQQNEQRLEDFDFDSFLKNQGKNQQFVNDMLEEPLLKEAQTEQMSQQQQEHAANDDDALAATAKELLEKVDHNQSDKFKNSNFLGLMRKLRDREMKVEGDKMVETVSATHTHAHPKRIATPDSGYESGVETSPPPAEASHNPTLCKAIDCDLLEAHRWDHWESPYT